MSTIRGSESFLSSFFAYIVFLAQLPLGVALHPVPVLTSLDVDGTLFIQPLAYLATTLFAAVYFNQVWLFVLSAFGVVWLDAQLAWRAEALGNLKMKEYIDEQVERGLAPPPYEEVLEKDLVENLVEPTSKELYKDTAEVVTEKPISHADPMKLLTGGKDISSVISSHISTATVCVLPVQVMETHFTPEQAERLQEGIESSIAVQYQQQQGYTGASPLRREILQTVLEEDEPHAEDDRDFDLMREMEAVHRELAKVWGVRSNKQYQPGQGEAGAPGDNSSRVRTRTPPEVPPRPKAPRQPAVVVTEIPALPEAEDENLALSITSMEELLEPGSCASSVRSFGDFIEAPTLGSGSGQDFSRPSTSHSTSAKKEIPHFPIIDDVLSEYEASMHSEERDRQAEYAEDHEGLTSGDESRNGFSDDSRCDSPATSVSSANDEDDIDIPALDVEKETKQAVVVEQPVEVGQQTTANAHPKRPSPCRASSSRSASYSSKTKRAPKKNNGWKRVPKKARLSPNHKKRFLSRAFW